MQQHLEGIPAAVLAMHAMLAAGYATNDVSHRKRCIESARTAAKVGGLEAVKIVEPRRRAASHVAKSRRARR